MSYISYTTNQFWYSGYSCVALSFYNVHWLGFELALGRVDLGTRWYWVWLNLGTTWSALL